MLLTKLSNGSSRVYFFRKLRYVTGPRLYPSQHVHQPSPLIPGRTVILTVLQPILLQFVVLHRHELCCHELHQLE